MWFTLQTVVHYGLHFLGPGVVAWWRYRPRVWAVWGGMLLTMVVDVDHLWATPIFDPTRCSVGFHTFHSWGAVAGYVCVAALGRGWWRVVALGLCVHMLADGVDCWWMGAWGK